MVLHRLGLSRLLASVVVIAIAGASLSACAADDPPLTELLATPLAVPQLPDAAAAAGRPSDVVSANAGSLGKVQLAKYGSTDGATGAATRVSGAFFVPAGQPPANGWPTVAIGHGTTGLSPDCGITRSPSTLGQVAPVAMLLGQGFAVALIDYQGLGIAASGTSASATTPAHPYLEPRTAAYNLVDSVRAMRALHPGQISKRWVAAGHSQGGQAAWATTEFAPTYAPELQLVGASAQAPAVNLRRLARVSHGGYTSHEEWLMPTLISGIAVSDRSINRWDYLRGEVRNNLPLLISCNPADDQRRQEVKDSISSADVVPSTTAAQTALAASLQAYSLPQRRTAVPLYVVQGSDDPVISASSTRTAVTQACGLGSSVEFHQLDGRDHDIGDDMSGYEWLAKLLHGGKPTPNCARG